ncbi:LuxR C-terminal-related transcriptional regulator [Marinospirillum insulare]|uniref:LuxR family transcriptional regulator n=1 Tax=Marinospirillum insulare TaxID=217169 RepID=A0ABQ5ZTN4_9GAMM|nr:LuxR C-terminal-related transcriptional regulator [Marinospirillum insulare]GLR63504.1 LuxR family transcriptional regulator [Marinospirillum insulare]
MTNSLLSFRFSPPKMPAQTLVRDRLLSQLETAAACRLTLVLAPAGSGKTLLLTQWKNSQRLPIAWLNLTSSQLTPASFIYGLVKSLRQLGELSNKLGEATLESLAANPSGSLEQLLLPLIEEIKTGLKSNSQLVIDAAENLSPSDQPNLAVLNLIDLLLQALPSKLSLIIASRAYLPLKQLTPLQLTDQLTLIQRNDLDFTQDEIRQLLQQLNKTIHLSSVTSIWQITLGWPAAIKFICQSNSQDITTSLALVRPFLQQEVLGSLTDQQEQLLAWLASLDAASAELLTELTANTITEQDLWRLAAVGLILPCSAAAKCVKSTDFINPEPWFRLHPLLAKMVFQKTSPASTETLLFHKRAAQALAIRGLFFPAAQQAFLAKETDLLATYMQKLASHLLRSLDPSQFLIWRNALDIKVITSSEALTFISCWALLFANQTQAASNLLHASEFSSLAEARLINCFLLVSEQKNDQAIQEALTLYPELRENKPEIAIHALHLITSWHTSRNHLRAARGFNREAQMLAQQIKSPELQQLLAYDQITLEVNKGHLKLAEHLLNEALQLPSNQPLPRARLMLLQGYLYWLQGKAALATQLLEEALAFLQPSGDKHLISGYLILSLVARSNHNLTSAFDWLEEAEKALHLQYPASVSWQPMITAFKASLWLDQGKLDLALTWLQQLVDKEPEPALVQLPLQNQLLYLLYSRALMSHRHYDQALILLNEQLNLTSSYPTAGVFLLVHQALALKHSRQTKEALATLRKALQLAEPENFCMPFLNADKSLLELLLPLKEQLAKGSSSLKFVQHLLGQLNLSSNVASKDPTRPLEELSVREEQVLILVAEGLANKEIAQRLFISLHTVKTHIRHILRKLDVSSRTQALTRARELRLL